MNIVIVGLGYVGAPLAVELAKHFTVIGLDVNASRVEELAKGIDRTNEIQPCELRDSSMGVTTDASCIADADVVIVTVPTPVDDSRVPDLGPVIAATKTVAQHMKRGTTVVYESTVYPGVTEEICVPLLEEGSGLKYLQGFHVGYSPERINPGDKVHTLTTTVKIVAGDTPETLARLENLYGKVTKTYAAPTIKVAEAAKVIENTQRDVNIALMNELSQILNRLDVDTSDVLAAARSKWNFLDFRPGLVGGHCISVDPYYLTHKSAQHGFTPRLMLAARQINDELAQYIVSQLVSRMMKNHLLKPDTVVTILGTTFKEDVPDIRNSKVADIYNQLEALGITAQVVDPLAYTAEVEHEYGYALTPAAEAKKADAIILAVGHQEYKDSGWDLLARFGKDGQKVVVVDLKAVLDREEAPARAIIWRP